MAMSSLRSLGVAVGLSCSACSLAAQCSNPWLPTDGILGANSNVYGSAVWDPDGPGPRTACLVVGGEFNIVGNVLSNPAMFDPATRTWSALPGLQQPVRINCFCSLPNGELVAGGLWVGQSMLARWNGSVWTPVAPLILQEVRRVAARGQYILASTYNAVFNIHVASGAWQSILSATAEALLSLPGGDVLVGTGNAIMRWDGTTLVQVALADGPITTLELLPNGDVLASGGFTTIAGVAAARLARWNGTTWSAVAPGVPTSVSCVAMPSGDIVVTGFFTSIGGVAANHIARWDGAQWSTLGSGLNGSARGLTALPSGDLFAIGNNFNTAGGAPTMGIAHFDGTAWRRVGGRWAGARVSDVASLPNGDAVAVGYFAQGGSSPDLRAARWHEGEWSPMGSLTLAAPQVVMVGASGRVLAGGYGDVHRWDGAQWISTNMAQQGLNPHVDALVELANGDVVAGGAFTAVGGTAAMNIARWNGSTWSPMGGLASPVTDLALTPDGSVVAAARQVFRWDGTTWTQLGSIAAGWSTLGAARLVVHRDGSLWATGELSIGDVVRWNGATWFPVGSLPNHTGRHMCMLPDGDVVVFGRAWGFPAVHAGSRWDGAAWNPLAINLQSVPTGGFEEIEDIEWLRSGELAIVGFFNVVSGQVAPGFARLGTTCPATTVTYGSGCTGSAGPVELAVDEPAWVGGRLRATATGIPGNALAIGIGGLAPSQVPLPLILAQGQPGCDLLAMPDALFLLLPNGGSVQTTIPIPDAPLYLNKQFFHQVVVLELSASGIGPVTSSNGIEVRIGLF